MIKTCRICSVEFTTPHRNQSHCSKACANIGKPYKCPAAFRPIRRKIHKVWQGMRLRCYQITHPAYPLYGGRGITVCQAWLDSFDCFQEWALLDYKVGLSIERLDNDGPYSPENCCWADWFEQASNRRSSIKLTAWGETKTVARWVRDPRCVVKRGALDHRLKRNIPLELALTTPLHKL